MLLTGIPAVAGTALVMARNGEGAVAHCCRALSRLGTRERIGRERAINVLASARHLRGLRSPSEVSGPLLPPRVGAPVPAGTVFLAPDYLKPHKSGRPLGKIIRKIFVGRETCHFASLFCHRIVNSPCVLRCKTTL